MKTGSSLFTGLLAAALLPAATVLARSTIHDTSSLDATFDSGHDLSKRHEQASQPQRDVERIVRSLPPQSFVLQGAGNTRRKSALDDSEGERVTYGGPGCPQSSLDLSSLGPISTAPSLSKLHDPTTLRLTYPSLNVSTSESVTFARSQCSLSLDLASLGPDKDRHYALRGLNTRVKYKLDGGRASAVVSLALFIPGQPEQRTFTKTLPPAPSQADGGDGEKELVLWADEELTPCPRGDALSIRASVTISGASGSDKDSSVSIVAFEPLFVWKDGSCEEDDSNEATKDTL